MTGVALPPRRLLLGLAVAGCGPKPPPPPPPTTLSLRLAAAREVNPDETGTPKPLRVRVLQMTGTTALSQAEFFAFDADPAKALGQELLAAEEVSLGPGGEARLTPEPKPGARFLGVVGAYFAIDRARWRAWAPVAPNTANAYEASFGAAGVTLTRSGA